MFYLIEISTGDAKITGRAVYEYGEMNAAIAAFHTKLGNAMKSDLFDTELVIVIDHNGKALKREKWAKPSADMIVIEPDDEEDE